MRNAIIVGASSGIGKELARCLAENGYGVGLAAQQIFDAIRKRRQHVYVTKRWRIIAWFLRFAPDWLYCKL